MCVSIDNNRISCRAYRFISKVLVQTELYNFLRILPVEPKLELTNHVTNYAFPIDLHTSKNQKLPAVNFGFFVISSSRSRHRIRQYYLYF